MTRPYPPGTTLVLKHGDGGRLFTVFEDRGEEGIVELSSMSSQQQYQHPMRRNRLINPGAVERAQKLVQLLRARAEVRDRAIAEIKQNAENDFEALYDTYETEVIETA